MKEFATLKKEILDHVKIVFIDIDGTLTDDNEEVSNENIVSIKKLVYFGYKVVLCTGRSNLYTVRKSIDANASEYVITSNGSHVYNYLKNESIYINDIAFNTSVDMLNYCNDNKLSIIMNGVTKRYKNAFSNKYSAIDKEHKRYNGGFSIDINESDDAIIYDANIIVGEKISQYIVTSDDYNAMSSLKAFVELNNELKVLYLSPNFKQGIIGTEELYRFDITPINANKGVGVAKLLEYLNMSKADAMAFGDGYNDISMFNACGYKIAMGNAVDELKQVADYVTLSNNDSGIAYVLEKLQN